MHLLVSAVLELVTVSACVMTGEGVHFHLSPFFALAPSSWRHYCGDLLFLFFSFHDVLFGRGDLCDFFLSFLPLLEDMRV